MKTHLRRLALEALFLWIFLGVCPYAVGFFLPDTAPKETDQPPIRATPAASQAPAKTEAGFFQIYDEATGNILTVSESEFLPLAVLCEMSPEAPDEALKAQAVAIRTLYQNIRSQDTGGPGDFSCNTETRHVYAPAETFKALYGSDWNEIYTRIAALCTETDEQVLTYNGKSIDTPYFALSAGCTQSAQAVWPGESAPWLPAVPCPMDLLRTDCQATVTLTPEEIRDHFPSVLFSDDPADWFSAPSLNPSGYVDSVLLCGTALTGQEVQAALSLRSSAFSVSFDGDVFRFTTLGWGHGVGMSQAGAMYLAETGADFKSILAYFYPGTDLH